MIISKACEERMLQQIVLLGDLEEKVLRKAQDEQLGKEFFFDLADLIREELTLKVESVSSQDGKRISLYKEIQDAVRDFAQTEEEYRFVLLRFGIRVYQWALLAVRAEVCRR